MRKTAITLGVSLLVGSQAFLAPQEAFASPYAVATATTQFTTASQMAPAATRGSELLSESFSDPTFPPAGWSAFNVDGGGTAWARNATVFNSAPGAAWHNWASGAQNGWLVSPPVTLAAADNMLSFVDAGQWMGDYFYSGVWVSNGSCDPANNEFVELAEIDDTPGPSGAFTWRTSPVELSLDAYAGETVCVAFRYQGDFAHAWVVDDISVFIDLDPPQISVDPASLSATQAADTTTTQTLTIANDAAAGSADLNWTIGEAAGSVVLSVTDHAHEQTYQRANESRMVTAHPAIMSAVDNQAFSGPASPAEPPVISGTEAINLVLDDGTAEDSIGAGGQTILWFNRFTPLQSTYPITLNEIQVNFATATGVAVGQAIDLYVYEDADGDPTNGATLVGSLTGQTIQALDTFTSYPVNITANGPGDILIAVVNRTPTAPNPSFPAAIDETASAGRSWAGLGTIADPPDLTSLTTLATIDSIGFPGNWLVRGIGTGSPPAGCDAPGDIGWLSLSDTSGTTAADDFSDVTVSFNSTGLADDTYEATLCVNSNDPATPLVEVPVTLTVTSGGGGGDMDITPSAVVIDVPVGTPGSEALTITNNSASALDWTVIPEEVSVMSEDFEGTFPPTGWTLVDDSTAACPWFQTDGSTMSGFVAAPGGSLGAAIDVDDCGSGQTYDSSLVTSAIDLTGYGQATLTFDVSYRYLTAPNLNVEVSTDGGTTWAVAHAFTANTGYPGAPVSQEVDLSAYSGQSIMLRWHWTSGWTWWGFIDNVEIMARDSAAWPLTCWDPSVDWLMVAPTSGNIAASDSEVVAVDVPDTLAPGTYNTELCFAGDNGTALPLVVVPVEVTVTAPEITVDPMSISATVDPGDSANETLTIGNTGDGELVYTLDEAPAGLVNPRAHFPAVDRSVNVPFDPSATAAVEQVPAEVLAKLAEQVQHNRTMASRSHVSGRGDTTVPAYTTTGFSRSDYVSLDALVPGTLTTILDPQVNTIYAATFLDNDFTRQFFIAGTPGTGAILPVGAYGYLDTTTGLHTQLGVVSNTPAGGSWTSAAQDPTTGTVYAVANATSGNHLFTVDPVTGVTTEVGIIAGAQIMIAIAISPEGLMYGLDIGSDNLVAIDKTNAQASVIGPVGQNANFAQDMDFDQSTGILYWAGYMGGGNSQMFTVDTATGATTLIGPIGDGAELLSFSVAVAGGNCSDPADVPWLTLSSSGGTIPAGGADQDVTVTMNSTGLSDGLYEASVCVRSNDPNRAVVEVPVSFQVGELVDPNADLALSLFSVPGTVDAGASVSIMATVANFGPSAAADVAVELELPAEFSFVSGRLFEGSGNWTCAAAAQTVTCDLDSGTLPTGQFAAILQVDADVDSGAETGTVTTTGTVSSTNPDPNPGNNDASATTSIIAGPSDLIFANGFEDETVACEPLQLLEDTSFEATDASFVNAFWPDHSDVYGGVLCSEAGCGNGGGSATPRTGTFWAWLGGTGAAETAWIEQSVVIPASPERHLNFWLRVGTVAGTGATLQVQVDGTPVSTISEPATPDAAYLPYSVDLSSYADGASHTIRFHYESPGTTSNFSIDDVTLECQAH